MGAKRLAALLRRWQIWWQHATQSASEASSQLSDYESCLHLRRLAVYPFQRHLAQRSETQDLFQAIHLEPPKT